MDFIEPCFGIGHNLSLICQMTSEDIKHQLIIIICAVCARTTRAILVWCSLQRIMCSSLEKEYIRSINIFVLFIARRLRALPFTKLCHKCISEGHVHACYVRLQASNSCRTKTVPKVLPKERVDSRAFVSIACTRNGTESVCIIRSQLFLARNTDSPRCCTVPAGLRHTK